MKLSQEEYARTQQVIVMVRGLLDDLPIQDFLADLEHADATAPFLDPTLWMKGHGELDKVRALAQAALKLQGCPFPAYAVQGADR